MSYICTLRGFSLNVETEKNHMVHNPGNREGESNFLFRFFLHSSIGGVAYVTVFNSSAT